MGTSVDNLVSLKVLFADRIMRIPDYQRGYAWTDEQRRDLLDDLEEIQLLQKAGSYQHFTGTFVLEDTGTKDGVPGAHVKVMDVVDGQQRLTTLIILLNEMCRCMRTLATPDDTKAADRIERDFIKMDSDGPYYLELNGEPNRFFRDTIINHVAQTPPTLVAEQNLANAVRVFRDYLERKREENAGAFGAYLRGLADVITTSLGFLVYEPSSQAQACFMFETMNARGLELTQLEKTKNLLFYLSYKYKVDDNQLARVTQDINDTWKTLWRDLAQVPDGEEDQFLRFHWVVFDGPAFMEKQDPTRTHDIHAAIRRTVKEKLPKNMSVGAWVSKFLTSLRIYSPIYRDLLNPNLKGTFGRNLDIRAELIELVDGSRRIGREANLVPLLMAAYHRLAQQPDEMKEIFRLAEVFSFRMLAIGRRSDAGRSTAFDIAQKVAKGELSAGEAVSALQDLVRTYCDDKKLVDALSDDNGDYYHWSGIRYFLFEYERSLQRAVKSPFLLDWEQFRKQEAEQSIEHILPQGDGTPTSNYWLQYWSRFFTVDEWKRCRHLLGNLNLARPEWNSSYSAKAFDAKRGDAQSSPSAMVYKHSPWICERNVAAVADWTPGEIERRQATLANWALVRWPIATPP